MVLAKLHAEESVRQKKQREKEEARLEAEKREKSEEEKEKARIRAEEEALADRQWAAREAREAAAAVKKAAEKRRVARLEALLLRAGQFYPLPILPPPHHAMGYLNLHPRREPIGFSHLWGRVARRGRGGGVGQTGVKFNKQRRSSGCRGRKLLWTCDMGMGCKVGWG